MVEVGFWECLFAGEGVERGDVARIRDGDHVGPKPDKRTFIFAEGDVCGMRGVGADPAGTRQVGEVAEPWAGDMGEEEAGGCVLG